jgi:hypothetical protein
LRRTDYVTRRPRERDPKTSTPHDPDKRQHK